MRLLRNKGYVDVQFLSILYKNQDILFLDMPFVPISHYRVFVGRMASDMYFLLRNCQETNNFDGFSL